MCVIAVSKRGVRQPTESEIDNMFLRNPDGAGYMYARDGKVTIHKGFCNLDDFKRAIRGEHFTPDDPVVYHFRISTQARRLEMTHPFPLTTSLEKCEKLDLKCSIGITHNGVIALTSDPREDKYSDTALFITEYMVRIIYKRESLYDPKRVQMIDDLTHSKWALMDGITGDIVTVGHFITDDLMFSNSTYKGGCNYENVFGRGAL